MPSVEAGMKGGGLSGQAASDGRLPVSDRFARRAEKPEAKQAERRGHDEIAGPSPAFQASVLELELDLQNTIARVEAARGKRESDLAAGLKTGAADASPAEAKRTEEAARPPAPEAEAPHAEEAAEPAGVTTDAAPEADKPEGAPDTRRNSPDTST